MIRSTALSIFCLIAVSGVAQAATLSNDVTDVTVDAKSGNYTVNAKKSNWKFAGTVGSTISQVTTSTNRDKLGAYQQIRFHWKEDFDWTGSIRLYQSRPLISFAVGNARPALGPTPEFPNFTIFPKKLHTLSFNDSVFAPPSFKLVQTSTPWVFFDDAGESMILSPASNFLLSQMHGDGEASISSGLNAQVGKLPAGFTHASFMVLDSGIRQTFRSWGNALTDLSGKPVTSDTADELIRYLGYWTDNGGHYYYNFDKTKGYTGTLLDLKKKYDEQKIPIRYLQLDSWWYQKSLRNPNGTLGGTTKNSEFPIANWNAYGGTLDYSASPELFPNGLEAFHDELGLPFAVHARWIDPTGPYRKKYQLSGIAPIDPKWWDERMAYLKANGVKTYEQDWLNEIYSHSPAFARDLKTGPAFTDNMARAAAKNGLTLQYCMATARYFLQGSKYPNLTTIRTSEDRFERGKWQHFLYTSLLADALRIRPWTDVFKSNEEGNLTIAALSTGPVGVGDELGKESASALQSTCRADGVLLKTSGPLLPTESSILADARGEKKPLIATSHVNNGVRSVYVFVYSRNGDSPNFSFTPASMGMAGQVYVYSPSEKTGKKMDATETFSATLGETARALYVITPVGSSGIALLGDAEKIVGLGTQRIPNLRDEIGQVTLKVLFAKGENSVTLYGFSATKPIFTSVDGDVSNLTFEPTTGRFSLNLNPNDGLKSILKDGDPVQEVNVVLKTK